MLEFRIDRSDVNVELLDAQLRAAGGALVYGLSAQRGGVTIYVNEAMPPELRKQLEQIARTHDATQMTPEQKALTERHAMLEQGRTDVPLSVDDFKASDPASQALARKIAWLEQEIRDLRGLS
jgi:hypothetical protein